jgi:hypothetical protein
MSRTGYSILDTGCWILVTGHKMAQGSRRKAQGKIMADIRLYGAGRDKKLTVEGIAEAACTSFT